MDSTYDFARHNEEVEAVWEAYHARRPVRVPLRFGENPRFTMFNHPANPNATTFEEYSADPDVMIERQIEHQAWVRENIRQDAPMGRPVDGWTLWVDFQNYYEAAWYGAEIRYHDGQVPDTLPPLADNSRKRALLDADPPDPFEHGSGPRMWDIYEHMLRRKRQGIAYDGLPIAHIDPPAGGTDGPLTLCCNLRGAAEFILDLVEDPEYADEMLDFVTETAVARIKAYRERTGGDPRPAGGGLADDSIQLISTEMYVERILPHHRRLLAELYGDGPHGIHLCGDATHHFPTIRDELNVQSFDTGYPVDFAQLREDVGPEVQIQGGPSVPLLQTSTPDAVRERTREILESGIMEGGRFILREGNNLAPGIPVENLHAMWDAVHEFGRYESEETGV